MVTNNWKLSETISNKIVPDDNLAFSRANEDLRSPKITLLSAALGKLQEKPGIIL